MLCAIKQSKLETLFFSTPCFIFIDFYDHEAKTCESNRTTVIEVVLNHFFFNQFIIF